MSNPLTNWLQSRKFKAALNQGNIQLAQELFENKQRVGARLSLLEKVFRDKIKLEESSNNYEREVLVLRAQISKNSEVIEQLTTKYKQIEQFIESTRNQVKHKEEEFSLIQQKLKDLDRKNGLLQKELAISIEQREGLGNQLKHKEYEFISIQQQLETRKQESSSVQKQLEISRRQTEALHAQVKRKEQEAISIQQQIEAYKQEKKVLINQISSPLVDNSLLPQNKDFKDSLKAKFKFNEINDKLLQCTGIDKEIFYDLEENIVSYLKVQFELYTPQEELKQHLIGTYKDISSLQNGRDPEYNSYLTPHVYFMRYFLEGVYSAYLAWFLVYESKLLQTKVNILDIGAGSGAMIYGLFSLFKSVGKFNTLPETHVSYCSLEQQSLLQHHGLEFWKQYIEKQNVSAVNTYYRFKTIDLFSYGDNGNETRELPNKFFDFVVISHCIFAEEKQRIKSHQVYKKIFSESLKDDGYILIIVQGRRLFQAYSQNQTENQAQEEKLVKDFINELGLKLEWYKYMTSTGKRIPSGTNFRIFAKENLHTQTHMSVMLRKYLNQGHDLHYTLDDYAILARK